MEAHTEGDVLTYGNSIAGNKGHPPGEGNVYDGIYGEAPPERGTFFRLQIYERVRISLVLKYMKG